MMSDLPNLFGFDDGQDGDTNALPIVTPAWADNLPRAPYALRLFGDALVPDYRDGDELVIDPSPHDAEGKLRAIPPGAAVLAHVIRSADLQPHTGIYLLNADGDLYDRQGRLHERGSFRLGGVVIAFRNR